jgi:hypothetical protein
MFVSCRFEYHMFYVSYPFVTYLLTLPRKRMQHHSTDLVSPDIHRNVPSVLAQQLSHSQHESHSPRHFYLFSITSDLIKK